jgi:hypothetical protein
MPIIIPEPPESEFDPETDWLETLDQTQPGGGDLVSCDRSEGQLVGSIPFRKKRDASKKILGYSYADAGAPYEMHRVAPWRHPAMPWLWATGVRFAGFSPVGNATDPDFQNFPKIESPEPDYDLAAYGCYNRAAVAVSFGQLPFLVIDDDEAGGLLTEYQRYFVQWAEIESALDTINAQTGEILWAEGPKAGQAIQQGISEYRVITRYTARWIQVPETYLFDQGQAKKIQAAIGTLNNATFLGFPAQTLLFQPPRFRRYAQPVYTADGQGLFAYDVDLTWLFFDPVQAAASPLKRGWQLLPDSSGKVGANGAAWYTAKRSIGSSVYLWPETDHSKIFDHVLKP